MAMIYAEYTSAKPYERRNLDLFGCGNKIEYGNVIG